MAPGLTPSERTLRAQLAAHTLHSSRDSRELTAAARAASPGSTEYFERQVDPAGVLPVAERRRRAEHAKKAHFQRLALASARARRSRRAS